MEANNIRAATANVLLDRGVIFRLKGAPFFLRLLRMDRIKIKPLRAGTILHIETLMRKHGLSALATEAEVHLKLDATAEIIATAALNGKRKIRYLSRPLYKLLLRLPAKTLIDMFTVISSANASTHFMIITVYFDSLTTAMMMTGHMEEGS
jgi:hypothetical protein